MRKGVIVIVDDQPLVQMGFKAALKCLDCSVLCFTSPTEALNRLEKMRPDCVVVDLLMPGLDGLEFTKRYRKSFHGASVPILLTSACIDHDVLDKAFKLGVDDFIEKPAGSVLLRQRVRNMFKMNSYEQVRMQEYDHAQNRTNVMQEDGCPFVPELED